MESDARRMFRRSSPTSQIPARAREVSRCFRQVAEYRLKREENVGIFEMSCFASKQLLLNLGKANSHVKCFLTVFWKFFFSSLCFLFNVK